MNKNRRIVKAGDVYDWWVVKEEVTPHNGIRRASCICACGTEKILPIPKLFAGKTTCCKSCSGKKKTKSHAAGTVYGDWTILKEVEKYQNIRMMACTCKCGAEHIVALANLLSGKSTQCRDCSGKQIADKLKFTVEPGTVFGMRKVISETQKSQTGARNFLCECVCGKQSVVSFGSLMSNKATKCRKCAGTEYKDDPNKLPKQLYMAYVNGADRRNIESDISFEDFYLITQKNCFYCGLPPSGIVKDSRKEFLYSGIDRIDSSKGYVKGNILPCCKPCNFMKNKTSQEEFIRQVHKVSDHMRNKTNFVCEEINPEKD